MPRFDSAGKMSVVPTSGDQQQRTIQPGRLMIVLVNPLIADDIIGDTVRHYGAIRSLHRPENNPKNVFVQFEDPEDVTDEVINRLQNIGFFKDVSRAKKADRFIDFDQDHHQQKDQQMQMQPKRPQKKRNDGPNNNFNGHNGHNNSLLGCPISPPKPMQPNIPLGCWFCTKLPSFECRCGAFYCDINCQRNDWPRHKDLCMPRLVPISYSHRQILENASNGFLLTPERPLVPQHHQNFNFSGGHQQQQHHQQNSNFSGGQQHQQQQQNRPQQRQQLNNQNRGAQAGGPKKNQPNQDGNKNGGPQMNGGGRQQQSPPEQQPKQQSQQQDAANDSGRVSQVGNKLQRLKLAKASSTVGKLRVLEHGPFPPEGARVKITASLNSGILYIYHNNSRMSTPSDYQELSNRVLKAVDGAQPLSEAPRVDDIIFAPYSNMLYRAKVLRVTSDDILEVQFVDFGNLDRVSWRESCAIADEDLKWARVLTYPVTLEGVDEMAPEMKAKLESYELLEEFELVKAVSVRDSDSVKQVVLKRPKENVTLNMQLVELKQVEAREKKRREEQRERERLEKVRREKEEQRVRLEKEKQEQREKGKIADPDNYRPVIFDDSLTIKQLPEDSKQTLLIIDASDVLATKIISVIDARDAALYEGVVQDCETRGQADPNPYQPTEETEVCLVRYENDWSRALYDITEGSFMLLDIGTIKAVPAENVRRFPPGLGLTVYNNEVLVENPGVLKGLMVDGHPESIHGQTIEAWVSKDEKEDMACIRIVPVPAGSQTN